MVRLGEVSSRSQEVPNFAAKFTLDIRDDEKFEALPGLHLINVGVKKLKGAISDGERGATCKKAGAYLGYRLITYSFIPTVANALSALVCAILTLITLPTRCCSDKLNRYFWTRLQGSFGYFMQNLVIDVIYDMRKLSSCCQ